MDTELAPSGTEGHPTPWIRKIFPPLSITGFGECRQDHPVSIVILARDEERCIGRCLNSVTGRGFDAIIVLDTGSVDATTDIAEEYRNLGVRLIRMQWPNSFADARNLAIDLVASGWIVFIDADEWLPDNSSAQLRNCLNQLSTIENAVNIAFAPVIYNAGRNEYVDEVPRIFRADSQIRYRGAVHEYPVVSTDADLPVDLISLDIEFLHDGYDPTVFHAKKKMERNLYLLDTARADRPDNPRWLYFTLRDALPLLNVEHILQICESLGHLLDAPVETGDRRSAHDYYRMTLGFACQGLAAQGAWHAVEYFCAEMDKSDQCDSPDAHYFRSMHKLLSGAVSDVDLARTIDIRQDDTSLSKSTICPYGRHLDALIAALLERVRGETKANNYLDLCTPWNDVFFEGSRLRVLHNVFASSVRGLQTR